MPGSNRSSRGFQQIPETKMSNPNDARIDIPLTKVETKTGARTGSQDKGQSTSNGKSNDEKAGFYQRHVAGRRRAAKSKQKDDAAEINTMGMIYYKILNFSIVTRYILYILPVGLLLALPIVIGATAAQNASVGCVRIVWIFTWLLIVWLSLWVSKLFAKCLPSVFQFLCGIVSSGTRKYALVIKNLEIYLSLCGWALASLATFMPIMTRNPTQRELAANLKKALEPGNDPAKVPSAQKCTGTQDWQRIIQKILAALLVASLILLVEKLLVQLISIGYHRTQFDSKIKSSKHKIHLLSLLYDASRRDFPAYCPEFAQEDYIINDSIDIGTGNGKGHRRTGSQTPMRLLQNVGRFGDKLTSAFGNIAQEVTGKNVFNPDAAHNVVIEALEKNRSAEALAKRIWMSFVFEGKSALFLEDIIEVLGVDHQKEAEEAFAALDRDNNGDISLDEMILTICDFAKERHGLATSLHDVDQAINVLDSLLCTVVGVVVIFIFVAFLNASFTTTLATAGTALLSLSFVFAATAQEVLGSCIFLFVKHAYDVLDRVDIGTDRLIVKHISLLFTVFEHVDTHKLTQVPNIVLNGLWIQNVSRSEAMRELLQVFISFDTTLEDIQLLKNEVSAFISDKDNSRDFQPEFNVEVTGLASMDKMELTVEIFHKSNWANETVRAARRSKFLCALVLALRKVPIYAPGGGGAALGSVDQPSYTVAVSDQQAADARAEFDKTKDGKRLVPHKKGEEQENKENTGDDRGLSTATDPRDSATPPPLRYRQTSNAENNVVQNLNSRHPAADTARHPGDYVEPPTPKSYGRPGSDATEGTDVIKDSKLDEVRGMLTRASSMGKRRPSVSSGPGYGTTHERLPRPGNSEKFEYDPYAYKPQQAITPTARSETAYEPRSRKNSQDERDAAWPQPPASTFRPPPTISEKHSYHSPPPQIQPTPQIESRWPTPQSQNPTPPPKDAARNMNLAYNTHPAVQSSAQSPYQPYAQPSTRPSTSSSQRPFVGNDPAAARDASPVRNPFQINALRSQAQGAGVPRAVRPESNVSAMSGPPPSAQGQQVRRPVGGNGNGNGPPRGQSQERPSQGVAVRPARSDSLR